MFTGLIEAVGTVREVKKTQNGATISIVSREIIQGSEIGDSISTNGVCLTISSFIDNGFTADVMPETLKRSGLGKLGPGSRVNLERAMSTNKRFGGHIVSGHIDGVGRITGIRKDSNAWLFDIAAPEEIMRCIVIKGSIAVDGTSLTVAGVERDSFTVSIIPHTKEETILSYKRPGDEVNLENDVIAKYIEKFIFSGPVAETGRKEESKITEEFLMDNGFI